MIEIACTEDLKRSQELLCCLSAMTGVVKGAVWPAHPQQPGA